MKKIFAIIFAIPALFSLAIAEDYPVDPELSNFKCSYRLDSNMESNSDDGATASFLMASAQKNRMWRFVAMSCRYYGNKAFNLVGKMRPLLTRGYPNYTVPTRNSTTDRVTVILNNCEGVQFFNNKSCTIDFMYRIPPLEPNYPNYAENFGFEMQSPSGYTDLNALFGRIKIRYFRCEDFPEQGTRCI